MNGTSLILFLARSRKWQLVATDEDQFFHLLSSPPSFSQVASSSIPPVPSLDRKNVSSNYSFPFSCYDRSRNSTTFARNFTSCPSSHPCHCHKPHLSQDYVQIQEQHDQLCERVRGCCICFRR